MKILWTHDKLSIGRYDDLNYFVGQIRTHTSGKQAGKDYVYEAIYYSKLSEAIKATVELVAGRGANDLREYAKLISRATLELNEAIKPLTQETE